MPEIEDVEPLVLEESDEEQPEPFDCEEPEEVE